MSDEAGQCHGGKTGRLCGGPLLPGVLRLQAVQIVRGTLRMGGCAEYRPLVVLQHRDPRRDIGGVILADFRREVEVGAEERCAKLGYKLLDGVAFIAETLAAEIAVKSGRVTRESPCGGRREPRKRRGP
jgi:hypothetical protein